MELTLNFVLYIFENYERMTLNKKYHYSRNIFTVKISSRKNTFHEKNFRIIKIFEKRRLN